VVHQDPQDSVFAKILEGKIPCKKAFEDDRSLAFHDINPQAPVHVLVIPKKPIGGVSEVTEEDEGILGHLFVVARKIAEELHLEAGYRLVVNEVC
jgi:histidine triad (HIT) family protein